MADALMNDDVRRMAVAIGAALAEQEAPPNLGMQIVGTAVGALIRAMALESSGDVRMAALRDDVVRHMDMAIGGRISSKLAGERIQ